MPSSGLNSEGQLLLKLPANSLPLLSISESPQRKSSSSLFHGLSSICPEDFGDSPFGKCKPTLTDSQNVLSERDLNVF